MSPVELAEARKHLNEYISKGWIRSNTFFYEGPILSFKEKDRTLRMCIDYRALKQQTRPNKYLLPMIDDLLNWLVNVHCIGSIDLYTGCY